MNFWRLLLVAASLTYPVAADTLSAGYIAGIGMPGREFAPGVLVFYANPYGSVVDQRLWVSEQENGVFATVELTVDSSCQAWLSVPYPRTAPTTLEASPGAPGSYTCRVSIARGGKPLGSVPVYLNVAPANGGTTGGIAAPTTLKFTTTGSPQSVTVNAAAYYATITPVGMNQPLAGGRLLTMQPAPGRVTAQLDDGLSTPDEQLYIETSTGFEVVRMHVGSTYSPALVARPATINVTAAGGARPADEQFTVTDTSNSGLPLTVTSPAGWVKVTPPSQPSTPATFALAFDTSTLPNGLYSTAVTVASGRAGNSPLAVPVVLLVTGSSVAPGTLGLAPASLSFSATAGGAQPTPQTISVSAASQTVYTATASTQSGGAWLRVVPPGTLNTTANPAVQVGVEISGMSAGTYNGAVTFAAAGTSFSRSVPVTLTIASDAPNTITAAPASLELEYRSGDALPAPAALRVGGTAGLAFTAAASSDGDWLSVTPAAGTVGASSAVSVGITGKAAGLAPGLHRGAVQFAATGGGPSATVPVTLNVSSPTASISRVVNAASYGADAIAAGEIVTIFGQNLGPAEGKEYSLDAEGKIATTAGGVEVLVGGYRAPVLYASAGQVSAIVPYEIASPFLASPEVVVKYGGEASKAFVTTQVSAAPGIFTADSSGTGRAAALNVDYTLNSPTRPAAPGEILQLYLTGEGQTIPAGVTGKITTVASAPPLTPQPIVAVAATVDGLPARVWFCGEAPGIVAGMMQVNVEVPGGARPGEVPVVVTVGSGANARSTAAGVTVSVR